MLPSACADSAAACPFLVSRLPQVIKGFSKQQGRVTSPWVEVGGVEWRLKVWPKGDDAAGGTHLSGERQAGVYACVPARPTWLALPARD